MADRPIIFSAPMVRALLDGRKSQTRRIIKRTDLMEWDGKEMRPIPIGFAPGDRLYVRESFVTGFDIDDEYGRPAGDKKAWYRATDINLTWFDPDTESTLDNPPWKPSIHMPRWASRLTLTVTDVRVQRLQEISEADATAEGLVSAYDGWATDAGGSHWGNTAVNSYRVLWNDLHGPDAWDSNPWIAAISFTIHHVNIDQMEAAHG